MENAKELTLAEFMDIMLKREDKILQAIEETKKEIRAEFKEDMDKLRTEFKEEIANLRTEFKQDMDKLRTEFKKDFVNHDVSVRFNITKNFESLRDEVSTFISEELNSIYIKIMDIVNENTRRINLLEKKVF